MIEWIPTLLAAAFGLYGVAMISFMLCNWLDFKYGVTKERRHMEGPELCLRRHLLRRWRKGDESDVAKG